MSPSEIEALRNDIRSGFQSVNTRLDGIDDRLKRLEGEMETGFHDAQQGIHGLMLKLLAVNEVNEIRSRMTNAPDLKNFPTWSLR